MTLLLRPSAASLPVTSRLTKALYHEHHALHTGNVCVCVRVFPFSFLFQPCSQAGELFGPHRDLETTSSCIWKASVYFENANVAHLKDWQARKDPQSKGRGFQSGALSLPLSHRDRSLSEPLKQAPGIWAKGSQFKWAAHLSQDQPGGWFLT